MSPGPEPADAVQQAAETSTLMVEVLREEMLRRGVAITKMSHALGRGQSYLTRAFSDQPREGPAVRLRTILEVLARLGLSEREYFGKVLHRLEGAGAGPPGPAGSKPGGTDGSTEELAALVRSLEGYLAWRKAGAEDPGSAP